MDIRFCIGKFFAFILYTSFVCLLVLKFNILVPLIVFIFTLLMIPSFFLLLILCILQFLQRDYKKYNDIMYYLIVITIVGNIAIYYFNLDLSLFNAYSTIPQLLQFIFILILSLIIKHKRNTKYYVVPVFFMLLYILLGVEFGYLFR